MASQGEVQQQAVVPCGLIAVNLKLKCSGQAMCMLMHKGLSWYETLDSPAFQSKKHLKESMLNWDHILGWWCWVEPQLLDDILLSHCKRQNYVLEQQAFTWASFYYLAVHKLSWTARAHFHVEAAEQAKDALTDLDVSVVLPSSTVLRQKGEITIGQHSHLRAEISKLNSNFFSKSRKHHS